ncbi:MAG TPA: N-acetylmuramoyl-L-alanine amidase [Luteolibacter sp.]|nr:N-acetylmuramoyl-L-alanine amidase [Luteolibacter sp.]
MSFRLHLCACFLWLCCGLGLCAAEDPVWEVVHVDGRDHVTARSMLRFYGFTNLRREGRKVVLENQKVLMEMTVGDQVCIMNGVKFVFSNPVVDGEGQVLVSLMDLAKLIDPVLRPNFIRNAGDFRTVIIDPGHGGKDPGATNALGKEALYNLQVAQRLKAKLEAGGYGVIMTRNDDRFLSLQQRVDLANAVQQNAIFISIHFNSGGPDARGIETFTLSPPGVAHYGRGPIPADQKLRVGNLHDSANIALATSVHGSVLRRLGRQSFDRGIKRARFNVLSGVKHPAILLEGGFMTHPLESRLLASEVYQDALVTGIVEAIAKYRFAVSVKPVAHQVRP